MAARDGHVRVLPLHVANKIAAGEVVERPASVVKELVENAIDAGSKAIRISVAQGGRKLVAVQDDGCGMTREDAVLSLERQATSKILDVDDIERIDTLGFRGEAIPSIASVSRFTLVTRRHDADEGTRLTVNAGQLADITAAGCPPGTLVEVRDLFCNVPARRKFLRAAVTEENHIKQIFTVHALAHPAIGFSLTLDGRELYRLAPATRTEDRVRDLFGKDFADDLLDVDGGAGEVRVAGFLERPNLNTPTRREQYIFINGRPATAPSIAYALKEAYPRRQGDVRPAAILFITLPPTMVDVNVHPTKREVRFRDNTTVKNAIANAITAALAPKAPEGVGELGRLGELGKLGDLGKLGNLGRLGKLEKLETLEPLDTLETLDTLARREAAPQPAPTPAPVQVEFAVAPNSTTAKPWQWFKYLAQTESGYLLIETDAGIVTVHPRAARERIAYERLLGRIPSDATAAQPLLIPETCRLAPADFARLKAAQAVLADIGFAIEEFGQDTFKVDAVPQLLGDLPPSAILATIARDLAEGGAAKSGARWREELVAKSIARSYAGAATALTEKGARQLVEELSACRMPYVDPRNKPTMIFTSTRELDRKFVRDRPT